MCKIPQTLGGLCSVAPVRAILRLNEAAAMDAHELLAVGDFDSVVPCHERDRSATVHARERKGHGSLVVDLSDHSQRVTPGQAVGIGLSSRER